MLPKDKLKDIIVGSGLLSEDDFNGYKEQASLKKESLEDFLLYNDIIREADLYEKASSFYDLPFIQVNKRMIDPDLLDIIPENIAIKYQMAPLALEEKDNYLNVVTCLPPDLQIIEFVERTNSVKIKVFFTTPSGLNSIINQYRKDIRSELHKIDFEDKDMDVINILHAIVENAIKDGASDIHIEPKNKKSVVLYRIDGIVREIISLPKDLHNSLVVRIKNLANLKVEEHRLPQDGRYKIVGTGYNVSLRVSVMPLIYGEKIVLRILHQERKFGDFSSLGFQLKPLDVVNAALEKSQGAILVVGPTGSGKTTTLYSILQVVNRPGVNTNTIEDPIEYNFPNINQSQTNPQIGYTFASGLRAFLRQDPDIIMVGEIRDQETAEIAFKAALTGHLLLSTLHTNDAASTLPRLLDMGIAPYLISSTIRLVIAQRLVRTICENCKIKIPATEEDKAKIEQTLGVKINDVAKKAGLSNFEWGLYKGEGCEQCKNEGFKGRIGIFEVLENSRDINKAILRQASSREINDIAVSQGMLTMVEDGALKIFQGQTNLEEILRIL